MPLKNTVGMDTTALQKCGVGAGAGTGNAGEWWPKPCAADMGYSSEACFKQPDEKDFKMTPVRPDVAALDITVG
jgi:hypothetical protein